MSRWRSAAGLACGRGVQVDDAMRTSDPSVYAIGECAEHRGQVVGLVAPIWDMAVVCAEQIVGQSPGQVLAKRWPGMRRPLSARI